MMNNIKINDTKDTISKLNQIKETLRKNKRMLRGWMARFW